MKYGFFPALVAMLFLTYCVPPPQYRGRHSGTIDYYSGNSVGSSYSRRSYSAPRGIRGRIVRTARRYLGTRYRRGGASPRGFDCSGLVMYVYKRNGIMLPRTAGRQYSRGKRVRLRRARPGDLVFFNTSRRKRISHVGIYVGGSRFIHAPRPGKRVRYASIRNAYWKKRFLGAVSYL